MKRSRFRRPLRRPERKSRTYTLRTSGKKSRAAALSAKVSLYAIIGFALVYGSFKGFFALENYVSGSGVLKIKTVEMFCSRNISKTEISALLPFDAGDNIFFINTTGAEKEIMKLKPELKKVRVRRYFGKVKVYVEERTPVGVVSRDNKRLGIDIAGAVFPLRGEYVSAKLPEIVFADDFEKKEIMEFVKIFSEKAKVYFSKSSTFYFKSADDAAVQLDDGTRIFWGKVEKENFNDKLRKLDEVLDDAGKRFGKVSYVDLNYLDAGRILVKPEANIQKQDLGGMSPLKNPQ